MKKMIALVLALVMVLSLSTVAFAVDGGRSLITDLFGFSVATTSRWVQNYNDRVYASASHIAWNMTQPGRDASEGMKQIGKYINGTFLPWAEGKIDDVVDFAAKGAQGATAVTGIGAYAVNTVGHVVARLANLAINTAAGQVINNEIDFARTASPSDWHYTRNEWQALNDIFDKTSVLKDVIGQMLTNTNELIGNITEKAINTIGVFGRKDATPSGGRIQQYVSGEIDSIQTEVFKTTKFIADSIKNTADEIFKNLTGDMIYTFSFGGWNSGIANETTHVPFDQPFGLAKTVADCIGNMLKNFCNPRTPK